MPLPHQRALFVNLINPDIAVGEVDGVKRVLLFLTLAEAKDCLNQLREAIANVEASQNVRSDPMP